MSLLAHQVGLGEPGGDFVIDIINAIEPKCVQMIPRRKSFDAAKSWIFETAREYDVAIHPISPNDKRRETHAHLKCDPRLFGQDGDRPVLHGDR